MLLQGDGNQFCFEFDLAISLMAMKWRPAEKVTREITSKILTLYTISGRKVTSCGEASYRCHIDRWLGYV